MTTPFQNQIPMGNPTFPSITPKANTDGLPYSTNVPITSTEADLWNAGSVPPSSPPSSNYDPVPVIFEQAVVASVVLTVTGSPVSNQTYVVLQSDLGDGQWVDVAWLVWTGTQGSAIFILSGGIGGANAFQQTRQAGTAPAANGFLQFPLGGRIRFVGKAAVVGSGSSSAGGVGPIVPTVTVTIKYKLTPLR